ncbi:hypothetical protein [Pseudomaricurvus sp. HS19]|uniref:hypothetical protein n=1 Tax=Pseudomaricurvus sp. HS19 TaxID=2692626 RepID=UPI00136E93D1|nr:hypothetical protein [Pseudomaricurvus sp. HS19]MYM62036.1 hypothetical protein [Pseudomaricurvus sp. HS19]
MHILGVPFRVKYLPQTICDWWRNAALMMRRERPEVGYSFVYFSYKPDFDYLYLSMQSLKNNVSPELIDSVYLFVDQKAPFDESQLLQLQALFPQLRIRKIYGFSWASTETTLAELNAFSEVAAEIDGCHYLVKVDSDILITSDQKLKRLRRSACDTVADAHHLDYQYGQGGFYLIRAAVARRAFKDVSKETVKLFEARCGSIGEDKVISAMLAEAGCPFHFTRLMLYPEEYKRINRLNKLLRWEFCALHHVNDKVAMADFSDRFQLIGRE